MTQHEYNQSVLEQIFKLLPARELEQQIREQRMKQTQDNLQWMTEQLAKPVGEDDK